MKVTGWMFPGATRLGRIVLNGDLPRFWTGRSGVAAVEFAMILPLMLALYIGVAEITRYVSADRKATLFARTLADLTSQPNVDRTSTDSTVNMTIFTDANRATVFSLSVAVLFPFSATNAVMRITGFATDKNLTGGVANPRAFMDWMETCTWNSSTSTCTYGTVGAFSENLSRCGIDTTVPAGVMSPDSYLIRGDIIFTYTPIIPGLFKQNGGTGTSGLFTFMSSSGVTMTDVVYMHPRANLPIVRVYSNGTNYAPPNDAPTVCKPTYKS